jgi:smad nuclear-interacting protein 1
MTSFHNRNKSHQRSDNDNKELDTRGRRVQEEEEDDHVSSRFKRVKEEQQNTLIDDTPIEKANFALSGALSRDRRTGNTQAQIVTASTGKAGASTESTTIVSKYSPPVDACGPEGDWRIFVFEGEDLVETLYLHRKGHFKFGREPELADIVVDNPSCSKEHAVIQYRKKPGKKEAKLYLIDLESINGTKINHEKIVPAHFIEIIDDDVVTFGDSPKEYVFKRSKKG